MFTGLIRHIGTLAVLKPGGITIACAALRPHLALGDSVAVNGACLTVAGLSADGFTADVLEATLNNTTLKEKSPGARVNLETALAAGEAFGGHFVQGHVDGTARLLERRQAASGDWLLRFELPAWLVPLVIDRGSIAIDGVSLTVQELDAQANPASFGVSIIPTTWRETALADLRVGQSANIEADMLIKAIRHNLEQLLGGGGITAEKLREWGYGGK
ncbi:riboflavin synthase [bacterium]|nr:riboflavin synthase [bacterium]